MSTGASKTQLYDQDWTGGETIGTMTFSESNGKTRLHNVIVYSSKEARDGALQTGMTEGMHAGYKVLDAFLESLKRSPLEVYQQADEASVLAVMCETRKLRERGVARQTPEKLDQNSTARPGKQNATAANRCGVSR